MKHDIKAFLGGTLPPVARAEGWLLLSELFYDMRRLPLLTIIIKVCVFSLALPAQSEFAVKDVFDNSAGFTAQPVCMVEDREGFLWIGTYEGLFRFDGSRAWEVRFAPDDSLSTHSLKIYSLALDKAGNLLWIGTGDGIFKYHLHAGRTEKLAAESFFSKGDYNFPECRYIYQDRQGEIWAHFAVPGLVQLKDGGRSVERFTWELSAQEDAESSGWAHANFVGCIVQDAFQDSILWIGTKAGLVRFNKNTCSVRRYFFRHPGVDMQKSANAMSSIYAHTDGKIYIGTFNGGLLVFDPSKAGFTQYLLHPEADVGKTRKNRVKSILLHTRRELWVTGEKELFRLNTETGELNRILGEVEIDFIDRAGNYWNRVETGIELYHRAKNQIVRLPFPDEPAYAGARPLRVWEDTTLQTLYVRTGETQGIPVYDLQRKQWQILAFPNGPGVLVKGHVLEKTGAGILANDMERFYVLPPGRDRFEPFPLGTRENPGWMTSLSRSDGSVFISGNRGYLFWLKPDADQVQSYFRADIGEPVPNHFNILTLCAIDDRGRPWLTCAGGYSLFMPDENRFLHVASSLDPDRHLAQQYRAFGQDRAGRMWCLGPQEIGWIDPDCPEDGVRESFNKKNGFPFAELESNLIPDRKGRFWLVSRQKDLISFDPEKLEYSVFEGMEPRIVRVLAGGELVFQYENSIGLIHPDSLEPPAERPLPYVAWMKVFDEEVPLSGSPLSPTEIRLGPDENFLSIGFSALGFFNAPKYRYAYRMEGVNKNWVHPEPGDQIAGYTDLDGGSYVFRLKVANSLGVWNETPLEWRIHVQTPWWETGWFRLSLLAVVAGAVYFLFRMRLQQQRITLENQRLQFEKEISLRNERDRIAAEMHDDLGTGLSTIRFLSLLAKEKESDPVKAGRIDKIARSAAEVMEKMADIIWVMNSRNDSLENFANYFRRYAGDYLDTYGIRFIFILPEKLPPLQLSGEQRRTLLLALKECLHNVVKHAGATEVRLQISIGGRLEITVQDNGKGLPLQPENNRIDGNGLQNIRRRMQDLGGEAVIENGNGVKVVLKTGVVAGASEQP